MLRLDGAGAAGAVVELDDQSLAQAAFDIDPHGLGHADEARCHQNAEVFMLELAVRRKVLSLCVGVDRHLSDFASTNCRDEVDGHRATPLGEQLLGSGCDVDVHGRPSKGVWAAA